jgi:hypothetical protein
MAHPHPFCGCFAIAANRLAFGRAAVSPDGTKADRNGLS